MPQRSVGRDSGMHPTVLTLTSNSRLPDSLLALAALALDDELHARSATARALIRQGRADHDKLAGQALPLFGLASGRRLERPGLGGHRRVPQQPRAGGSSGYSLAVRAGEQTSRRMRRGVPRDFEG